MQILPFIIGISLGFGGIVLTKKHKNKSVKTQGSAAEVINFFKKKGLTEIQAMAIAGNLKAESDFNTTVVGDNGEAYGIAQWRGGRLKALLDFSNQEKQDPKYFYTQLNFLWRELNTSEKTALAKLNQSNTLEAATINFAKYYERPQVSTYPLRVKYAQEIYNVIT